MAITRSWSRRRRSSRKSSGSLVPVSGKQAEYNLAQKVVRLTRLTKGLHPELKYMDVSISQTNVDPTNGSSIFMNQVGQGTAIGNRVGDSVMMKSFYIAMNISTAATSYDLLGDYYWRVFVVLDKETRNAPVAGADLLDNPALPVNCLFNQINIDRFKVLYDSKPMLINTIQNVNSQAHTKLSLTHYKKINIKASYTGASSTGMVKNPISVVYITNANIATAGSLDVFASSRIAFTDV